jgi:hypothetical protein
LGRLSSSIKATLGDLLVVVAILKPNEFESEMFSRRFLPSSSRSIRALDVAEQ